jgi:splicing factor U2AF subunit
MHTGRFCFMELRTLELADHMITLDKMEVCGRPLKIGRPKGYEEEAAKLQSQQKLSMAQTFAAQVN